MTSAWLDSPGLADNAATLVWIYDGPTGRGDDELSPVPHSGGAPSLALQGMRRPPANQSP